MQYPKQIQTLKTQLALPLQKAKTLLEQTAGDIPAAIALYHQENIATIMAETECEHWEAENVYERFSQNVEKAVKHIFSTSLTISVEDKRDTTERGMGYLISALDANLNNLSKRSIFIPIEDFDKYLLKNFKSVFPLYQPQCNKVENYFNCTTSNVFDSTTCRKIIAQLRQHTFTDDKVKIFIQKVIANLEEKLLTCAYIEVYGNI
ncbi:hypothetical protein [Capnocytophaga sp. oral taxon 878]|uniref:hypothetical protein n=1 Tax=Capnocytophaga sp. oral taxon 878 TaxID=1316596 RepID=UPI000D0247E0|nr:hypothetical protein [Capnocytophaga sp. oral taxon 878]AVM49131.1 hypothetical protein C4H12_00840 [Capnocytophaga sp. oral taxon 878]